MRTMLVLALMLCTACTYTLGNYQPGDNPDKATMDNLVCKDQARLAAESTEHYVGSFLLGLTIIGTPGAFIWDRNTQRSVWADCMRQKGYAVQVTGEEEKGFVRSDVSKPSMPTLVDVNQALARVDRVWQLEYQRTEDEFRYRVIEADYLTTYQGVKRAFLDLDMPIQSADPDSGLVVGEATAPSPLSREEWKEIVKIENPRMKEIGGWFLEVREDPKDYIVTFRASLKSMSGKTFVLLDYSLDNPKMRAMGITPAKYAPPLAVQLACVKFWTRLAENLKGLNAPPPRKRMGDEKYSARFGQFLLVIERSAPRIDQD